MSCQFILVTEKRMTTSGIGNLRPADTFYPARGLISKLCIYPARNLFM